MERLARESKERAQVAQTVQDQAAVKEEQLRREVDRLMTERKNIALQRQVG